MISLLVTSEERSRICFCIYIYWFSEGLQQLLSPLLLCVYYVLYLGDYTLRRPSTGVSRLSINYATPTSLRADDQARHE